MSKVRLIIADDHKIIRNGIRSIFEDVDTVEIVGEASNGQEAVNLVKDLKPDILLMDISMPVINGIEATKQISDTVVETKVVILSMHENEEYVHQAFEAGAEGYLLKDADNSEIIKAVMCVADGDRYISPVISEIFVRGFMKRSKQPKPLSIPLTTREKEILKLIVVGKSNKEIASQLFISPRTVDAHRANVMEKLNVKNAAELVKISIEQKLV